MRLQLTKEWFDKAALAEDTGEVAAGAPDKAGVTERSDTAVVPEPCGTTAAAPAQGKAPPAARPAGRRV